MRVLLRWFDFVTSDVAAKGRRLAARWSGAE
jgi:hypothetical protein